VFKYFVAVILILCLWLIVQQGCKGFGERFRERMDNWHQRRMERIDGWRKHREERRDGSEDGEQQRDRQFGDWRFRDRFGRTRFDVAGE
jgi:hypothetical protein